MKVLIIEDDANDAELVAHRLERHGFTVEWRRVDSPPDIEKALADGDWDVVLADYDLGAFTALDALAMVRRHDPDLPVIVVSGGAGEREAVEVRRTGAHDSFDKDRLEVLGPAVEGAIREAQGRLARRRAETERDRVLAMLQLVLDTVPQRIFWKDRRCGYLGCNRPFAEDAGLRDPSQILGKTDHDLAWAPSAELYRADDRQVMEVLDEQG